MDSENTTMNGRVRAIRKAQKLTQKEFGDRIGMKPNSISDIEKGKNAVTDYVFKLICKEFNVEEEWLRTGKGDMFIPEDMQQYMELGRMINTKNEFKQFILGIMAKVPDETWDAIYEEFKAFQRRQEKQKK